MKKELKKKLLKLENKIVNLLNKTVTISTVMWIVISLCIIFIVLVNLKHTYHYIGINNETGTSYRCYQTKRELLCEVPISVKQYYKD